MKRLLLTLLLLFLTFTLSACSNGTTSKKDFEYRNNADGITIEKYIGKAKEVYIPEKIDDRPVTRIGDSAFKLCTKLTKVVIPDGVTVIGKAAFSNCTSLASMAIPNSVKEIGGDAFLACDQWTGSVTVPDGVAAIYAGTFAYCRNLTSITLPASLREIGASAFYLCSGLTSLDIPDSVINVGRRAFLGCDSLVDISYRGARYSMVEKVNDNGGIFYDIPDEFFENGSGALTVYVSPNERVWELRNSLSKSKIDYTVLKYGGQEVIDVLITSGVGGTGIYLSFTEEQKPIIHNNTISYHGGTVLIKDFYWNYSLENGVLTILKTEDEPA